MLDAETLPFELPCSKFNFSRVFREGSKEGALRVMVVQRGSSVRVNFAMLGQFAEVDGERRRTK